LADVDISTALTVEHFCQMFGVSEPLYRALRRNHLGPREVRVGDVRFNAHCGLKSDIAACPKRDSCAAANGIAIRSLVGKLLEM
jgi:hypothetical protein